MFELTLILSIYVAFVMYWWQKQITHTHRLGNYKIRIHVNGTRGKSTVTRLIAGILREAGYRTLGKTTGSAAMIIDMNGDDHSIKRRGPANIKEQLDIITEWEPINAEAMVIECMALRPKYQEWSEKKAIKAHIGVITNIREDHQEVMGETLPEIARSLAHMCPTDGFLITAEDNPELQTILEHEAYRRSSELIVAHPSRVQDEDISQFNYIAFKDNVAIGLAVADLLGIERDVAMRGMYKAKGDIGAVRLQNVGLRGKHVIWANFFATNDRESMIISMEMLEPYCDSKTVRIGILNNRTDRVRRAKQFSIVAAKDLSFDWLVTFGDFEELVTRRLVNNGFPADRIVNLGFSVNPSLDQIIDAIASMIPEGYRGILVGFVNIHTPQAEMMMEYFDHQKSGDEPSGFEIKGTIGYLQQQQFEMSHR